MSASALDMPFPELTAYFTAEKHGGLLLIALAVASLALAIYLFATKSLFSPMAWPVLVLGGIELVIGVTVAGRASAQIAEIEAGLQSKRTVTITAEIERMARVNGTFELIKKVEIALIAVSILFMIVRPAPDTLGAMGSASCCRAPCCWSSTRSRTTGHPLRRVADRAAAGGRSTAAARYLSAKRRRPRR